MDEDRVTAAPHTNATTLKYSKLKMRLLCVLFCEPVSHVCLLFNGGNYEGKARLFSGNFSLILTRPWLVSRLMFLVNVKAPFFFLCILASDEWFRHASVYSVALYMWSSGRHKDMFARSNET